VRTLSACINERGAGGGEGETIALERVECGYPGGATSPWGRESAGIRKFRGEKNTGSRCIAAARISRGLARALRKKLNSCDLDEDLEGYAPLAHLGR